MTRSRIPGHVTAGALALAIAPAFWPGDAMAAVCPATDDVQLTAGQTIDAGDVKVCNDADTLFVEYDPSFPWCLLATDLHVATIPDPPADPDDNIPQNPSGNPTPDEFADGDEYECAGEDTFEIPLNAIDGGVLTGDTVAIAAHADVFNVDTGVEEGAWGAGTRFVERGNWATYFTYEVQAATCGDGSKCVFVTSSVHNGNLGGLAGADAICNARATEAGLPGAGSYLAWLSDDIDSPSTRFATADANDTTEYRLVSGGLVAVGWSDLTDATLNAPISVTEAGGDASGMPPAEVMTSTLATGEAITPNPERGNCANWTSDSASLIAATGLLVHTDFRWTEATTARCDAFGGDPTLGARLYCFQQP